MKIGRSLSFCVLDIARGLVDINDVLVIVTRTKYQDDADFAMLMGQYKKAYWANDDPDKCEKIATHLHGLGKIHQPRLMSNYSMSQLPVKVFWYDLVPGVSSDPVVVEAYETYAALLKLHG